MGGDGAISSCYVATGEPHCHNLAGGWIVHLSVAVLPDVGMPKESGLPPAAGPITRQTKEQKMMLMRTTWRQQQAGVLQIVAR